VGITGLIWKHRIILLIATLTSAAVTVPFTLRGESTYESQMTVLIPYGDPLSQSMQQSSGVTVRLLDFADGGELGTAVREALGSEVEDLISVSADQQRAQDLYTVSAVARSSSVAQDAAAAAAQALIDRSNELAAGQVERLRARVVDELAPLDEQRAALIQEQVARETQIDQTTVALRKFQRQLASSSGDNAALEQQIEELSARLRALQLEQDRTDGQLALLESEQAYLSGLVEEATQAQLAREAASTPLSSPSRPQTNDSKQVVETVGLALATGLIWASLVLVWLERRRLLPSSSPAGASSSMAPRRGYFANPEQDSPEEQDREEERVGDPAGRR
jgi:hypothetical protein